MSDLCSALRLERDTKKILSVWQKRVRHLLPATFAADALVQDFFPKLIADLASDLNSLSSRNPVNSPNSIIDSKQKSLRSQGQTKGAIAQEHAAERARAKHFELGQLILEYQLLRKVILENLKTSGPLSTDESEAIADGIDIAIQNATTEFVRLRNEQLAQSNELLRVANDRFRIVLEGVDDHAIIRVDHHGTIVDWSAGAQKMFGHDITDVVGKDLSLIYTPADAQISNEKRAMTAARQTGKDWDQRWLVKKDGTLFFATGTMNPLHGPNGEVIGYLKVLRDSTIERRKELRLINEKEQAVTGLLYSEAARKELFAYFMQAPVPMCVFIGPEHTFTLANPPYIALINRHPVGEKLNSVFSPDEVGHFKALLDVVYQTGIPYAGREVPLSRLREDGATEQLTVNIDYHPFREENGSIKGVLAFIQDVTEQVAGRRAIENVTLRLSTEKRKFQSIFNDATFGMALLKGNELRFEKANPKFIEITGGQNLVGRTYRDSFPEKSDSAHMQLVDDVFASGEPATEKEVLLDQRSPLPSMAPRYFDVTYTQVKDGDGQPYGVYIHAIEVTEKVSSRSELCRAIEDADKANQLKTSFLANMSHEIRTPMTAILGFTEVLKDSQLSEKERQDAISRVDSSGRALLRLIDDVLDISKIEAGKLTIQRVSFAPLEIVAEVINILRDSAERKDITLKLRVDPNYPSIARSDPTRIRQILMNLVGNAVKFTSKGEVVIHLKVQNKTQLVFEVCDSGIGISPVNHAALFKPFAQADPSITRQFGGTGLGLILSKRLAENLGGSLILVESKFGEGSRFRVIIEGGPLEFVGSSSTEQKRSADRAPVGRPTLSLRGASILLVDDVADNRVLLSRYLTMAGARVSLASDGEEAVHKAMAGDFDLILMDIQMPRIDGIQATKMLRSRNFLKPILALTAHATTEEAARSISSGCNAHLTKPITKSLLFTAIESQLAKANV